MKICDNCGEKKVRRLVKVKDIIFGKGFTDFDLCETCYQKVFKTVLEMMKKQKEAR